MATNKRRSRKVGGNKKRWYNNEGSVFQTGKEGKKRPHPVLQEAVYDGI